MTQREYTEKQQAFLRVIFHEANGDFNEAKRLAGYSDSTSVGEGIKTLKDEVLELTKEYLALNAPRAAIGITGILRDPGQLGTANLLKAATEILDRVGVQKTDKVEVAAPNGIMLLPPKQVDDEEE